MGHEHKASRPSVLPVVPAPLPPPATAPKTSRSFFVPVCGVPGGLLPTLVYSVLALLVPLTWYYILHGPETIPSTLEQSLIIGAAAVAGLVVVLANECCCWYNMMLAFHIGIEVNVIDKAFQYAIATSTPMDQMAWSIAAAVVIIVHLLPFLLVDNIPFLVLLAYVGTVVNVITVLFIDAEHLLIVFASCIALLAITIIVGAKCEVRTSLLSLLRDAVNKDSFLTCRTFEL